MPAPKGHKPYNTKGEGGAPKKYTKEFIENEAKLLLEWLKKPGNFWMKDFAFDRDYDHSRMLEFCKENERFARAYKKAKTHQENFLIKKGLNNEFNAGFTKFVMVNNHKYREHFQEEEQKFSGSVNVSIHKDRVKETEDEAC